MSSPPVTFGIASTASIAKNKAIPAFLAVDVGDLDVGVSDEIAFVDEIQFVDEMPDPVPEAPAAPQAAAADVSSVSELYSR